MNLRSFLELDPLLNSLLDPLFNPQEFLLTVTRLHPDLYHQLRPRLLHLQTLLEEQLSKLTSNEYEQIIGRVLDSQQSKRLRGEVILFEHKITQIQSCVKSRVEKVEKIRSLSLQLDQIAVRKQVIQKQLGFRRLLFKLKSLHQSDLLGRSSLLQQIKVLLQKQLQAQWVGQQRQFIQSLRQIVQDEVSNRFDKAISNRDKAEIELLLECGLKLQTLGDLMRRHCNQLIKNIQNDLKKCFVEENESIKYCEEVGRSLEKVKKQMECLGHCQSLASAQQMKFLESRSLGNPLKITWKKVTELIQKILEKLGTKDFTLFYDQLANNYPAVFAHLRDMLQGLLHAIKALGLATALSRSQLNQVMMSLRPFSQLFMKRLGKQIGTLLQHKASEKGRALQQIQKLIRRWSDFDDDITKWLVVEVLRLSSNVASRKQWTKSVLSWVSPQHSGGLDLEHICAYLKNRDL